MRRSFTYIVLAALLSTGCIRPTVTPAQYDLCGPRPTEEQVVYAVSVRVGTTNWKDPNSIVVRNARVRDRIASYRGLVNGGGYHYGWLITYEVNGRNSYGGLTGFQEKELLLCPPDCKVCNQ